jgi:hypothetical protein
VTKKTIIWYFVLPLLLVLVANWWGLTASYQRMRDQQRNLDLGSLEVGLRQYQSDYGSYPLSDDRGLIIACAGETTGYAKDEAGQMIWAPGAQKPTLKNLVACEWGKDYLGDATDTSAPRYVSVLPKDSLSEKGLVYWYVSDGKTFQLYAHFEITKVVGFDRKLTTKCGTKRCNIKRVSP